MLLKILLISSKERFVQSVQTTGLEYFASKSLARFFVSSEYGVALFKTITKGFFSSFNSETTRSSAFI